jgi:hypothetical protein
MGFCDTAEPKRGASRVRQRGSLTLEIQCCQS